MPQHPNDAMCCCTSVVIVDSSGPQSLVCRVEFQTRVWWVCQQWLWSLAFHAFHFSAPSDTTTTSNRQCACSSKSCQSARSVGEEYLWRADVDCALQVEIAVTPATQHRTVIPAIRNVVDLETGTSRSQSLQKQHPKPDEVC